VRRVNKWLRSSDAVSSMRDVLSVVLEDESMDISFDKIQTIVEGLLLLVITVSKWFVAIRVAGGSLLFERRFHVQGVNEGEEDNSPDSAQS
jgi:hypothetical protein